MRRKSTERMASADRRELLLVAAAEHFAERGYRGADMSAIAASAGVTKVIAYRAFGSKQSLYEALLDRHRDELLQTLISSAEVDGGSNAERIRTGLEAWFSYVEGHPFAWRLLFRDTTGLPVLEERHRAMRAQARAVIARLLIERMGVAAEAAPASAEFLRAAIVGIAMWWLEHPDATREEVVTTAHRLAIGAISAVGQNDHRRPQ
jgi:AcrR family transcriptional regulator